MIADVLGLLVGKTGGDDLRLERREITDQQADDRGIEARAGLGLNDLTCLVAWDRGTIRTSSSQGVKRIRDRQYSRCQRDLLTLEPLGIAEAVPTFVMVAD